MTAMRESPSDVNPTGLGLEVKGITGQIYGMSLLVGEGLSLTETPRNPQINEVILH